MIMPAGMIILTKAAGPERIGRVMAIIGVPMMIGPILGPVLGGWLVTDVGWRWIFFINAPIGAIALLLSARVLPRDIGAHHQKLDFVDLLLVSPGLAILIYGLAKSSTSGGFGSAQVLIPLAIGAALLATFVWHALRAKQPLIDLRLFKDRTFTTSTLTLVLVAISAFGSFLLLPLFFQWVHGETALKTGILLIPQGLGSMIAMPIAGVLSDKTGPGRIVPFGLLVMIASVAWLTQLTATTSYTAIQADFLVFGIGMGFTMMPVFTGAVRTLRDEAVARGSTALNILQQTGASIGTAVLSVVLYAALKSRLPASPGHHATSFGSIPKSALHHVAPKMADAFGYTFWWATAMLAIAFLASLALPKSKPAPAEGEAAAPTFAAI
jgi:EmrB/QacA subfamily drug resistance transporter